MTCAINCCAHQFYDCKSRFIDLMLRLEMYFAYRNEFGLEMIAGHQVQELQIEVSTNTSGHHLDGTARRRTFKGSNENRLSHSRIPSDIRNLPGKQQKSIFSFFKRGYSNWKNKSRRKGKNVKLVRKAAQLKLIAKKFNPELIDW